MSVPIWVSGQIPLFELFARNPVRKSELLPGLLQHCFSYYFPRLSRR